MIGIALCCESIAENDCVEVPYVFVRFIDHNGAVATLEGPVLENEKAAGGNMDNMGFDKRHKTLLSLLDEDDLRLRVEYVREDVGRVYFQLSGDYQASDMQGFVPFDKKFATEVVCDLYEDGYLELTGAVRDIRETMAKKEVANRRSLSFESRPRASDCFTLRGNERLAPHV